MSNTRKHPSILDTDNTCDKDNWLVSVVYNKEVGPFIFIEGATNKGTKKESAYFGQLTGKGSHWKMFSQTPNKDAFPGSLYLTYPVSKEQAAKVLKLIDKAMAESDFDLHGLSSSSDEDDNKEKKASDNQTLFSSRKEERQKKRQEKMYQEYYEGIREHFHDAFDYEVEFPQGLEAFKLEAEVVQAQNSPAAKP